MRSGAGTITEVFLTRPGTARITCEPGLIPGPGQYLLADIQDDRAGVLPVPIFPAGMMDGGFLVAAPLPSHWLPGTSLHLRGPLGQGFHLPAAARAVALAALGDTPDRLAALIAPALAQGAAVSLLCDQLPAGLPNDVEIMPASTLPEIGKWADYLALDLPREKIQSISGLLKRSTISDLAQILLTTPMPCGGRGDCGVCAVNINRSYKLICKDGPVFELNLFL